MASDPVRLVRLPETIKGDVLIAQINYTLLVEIGIYTPEILSGAGKVLRAVVSKHNGGKWCAYTSSNKPAYCGRSKLIAVETAIEYAQKQHDNARICAA